jgi:hypothetical protein
VSLEDGWEGHGPFYRAGEGRRSGDETTDDGGVLKAFNVVGFVKCNKGYFNTHGITVASTVNL